MRAILSDDAPPCLLVLFGASGDLTQRLLLPALYNLAAAHLLPDGFRILGFAADDWTEDKFRTHISETLKQFWGPDVVPATVQWLQQRAFYQTANFKDPSSFTTLANRITDIEKGSTTDGNRLFYLAVAPSFIAGITHSVSEENLLCEKGSAWRRIVIEKPFGHDLASAKELNAAIGKELREEQVYRIDHFAGKETVQDLAVFRFSNTIFEPIWNRANIDFVEITAAETVGVELRASYYEASGALRDMVPNHLAQLLSLIAMEPPVSFNADHMRSKQVELLQSIQHIQPEQVADFAVRGQYTAGTVLGKDVPGYRSEPNVDPSSTTETYVAMRVLIDNWRWSGVPFYLRTGKRLAKAYTQVVVTFRQPPASLFPNAEESVQAPNRMIFRMQPDQGIHVGFGSKAPGLKTMVEQGFLDYCFPNGPFGTHAKGYERLLHDCMLGNQTLFQRADMVEAGWQMVQPLLDAWSSASSTDSLQFYAAGSPGPEAAQRLLEQHGHAWTSMEAAV
jgi:glucose-6-phosphate 1-dehydrogenase